MSNDDKDLSLENLKPQKPKWMKFADFAMDLIFFMAPLFFFFTMESKDLAMVCCVGMITCGVLVKIYKVICDLRNDTLFVAAANAKLHCEIFSSHLKHMEERVAYEESKGVSQRH